MSGSLINIDDIESYEWYLDSADLNNLYTEFKNVKVSLKENYKLSDIAQRDALPEFTITRVTLIIIVPLTFDSAKLI